MATVLILTAAAAIAGTGEGDELGLREIATGVFLHQGRTVPFDDPNEDDIANLSFVVGDRCMAVIDTGGSLKMGRALRRAVKSVTKTAICYVINTHVHPDHTLGNAAFSVDNPKFVGHARLPNAFSHNREFFLHNYSTALEGQDGSAVLIAPDVVVEDTLGLDLGGRTLRLRALPPGHTDQDLSVFDATSGTLWLGSLFVERVPALDAGLRSWIDVMHDLTTAPADRVIPGNGPAPAPWPDAAAAQINSLETLARETRALLREEGYLEEALESVGQGEREKWLLFDQHHPANVTRAYTELEWE